MRMGKLSLQLILLVLLGAHQAMAGGANIEVGKMLPSLEIAEKGECVLKESAISYEPWHTDALQGQVQILEHVAARAGVDKINASFYAAVKAAIPEGQLAFSTIVNSDDAMWGTSGLVPGEIEKNKRKEPNVRFIIDTEGLALSKWGLEAKSAAIAILDAQGKVLYFKEGGFSDEEITQGLSLIKQQLEATVSIAE